jgi:hypothetical protein
MHQWQTLWSISGPELPEQPIWITQSIHIRPRNATEVVDEHPSTTPQPTLTVPHGLYVVHYPPRDEVQGSHRVQINIDAETEDDAVREAEQICERLTATLSLAVSGTPYFAQLLNFRRVDQEKEYSGWSQVVRISPLAMPSALENRKLKFSMSLSGLIEGDETANNAFLHLSTAWQLQATSGAKPLQRSILQHYVLSVEAVVNGVMSKIRKEKKDAIKLAEQRFSKEFTDNLPKRADKAKAIREASTKLREISLANMIPSIDSIGPIMSIPEDICISAKDLYRFRSRNLSHPGKKQDDGMQHWLKSGSKTHEHCLADTVARAFLLAYCNHVSTSRSTDMQ